MIAAGMEMVTLRLALGLRERDWEVGVTCLVEDGVRAADLRRNGVRVQTVPEPGFVGNLFPRHLVPWLKSVQPDVVHVHSGAWIKGAHAARRAGVPRIVFTEHGLLAEEPWYSDLLKRWGAVYCDDVVAVSEPLREYLRAAGVPKRKLRTIVNGVNTTLFAPGHRSGRLRAALGIGAAPVIGHVGRLAPEKNQGLLLHAFGRVVGDVEDAHLIIIGDGPLKSELVTCAEALGIAHQTHFVGQQNDMPDVYREFDVFVLPSLAEGTSMSLLEAMATGCAVVASAVGGTPSMLENGRCGTLVSPNDVDALAAALRNACLSPRGRTSLGFAARERVVVHYSEERMIEEYLRVYSPGSTSPTLSTTSDSCVA